MGSSIMSKVYVLRENVEEAKGGLRRDIDGQRENGQRERQNGEE